MAISARSVGMIFAVLVLQKMMVNAEQPLFDSGMDQCTGPSCGLVLLQQHAGPTVPTNTHKKKKNPQHLMAVHGKPSEMKAVPSTVDSKSAPQHAVQPQASMMAAYGLALAFMIASVTLMFHPMGFTVCFQVILYVCCLAFVKIAMKLVYDCGFNYPKFITSLHLGMSSMCAFAVLIHKYLTTGKQIAIPTSDEFFFGILPIALTFGLSIGAENSALVFVSAAFSEVVAASNPVMSAFLTWALGMDFNMRLVLPIMVVVLGCCVSVTGELFFSGYGLALLLMSVFFRGLKAVMQQKLMTGETKERFDPVTLMAWSCLLSFFEVLAYSIGTEGSAPITTLMGAENMYRLVACILGSCVIACTLNISALFVIKQLGAVGMQMVSQMKSLLVVMGGILLLDEPFTNMQKVGFVTVLAGVYWYSHMKRILSTGGKSAH